MRRVHKWDKVFTGLNKLEKDITETKDTTS